MPYTFTKTDFFQVFTGMKKTPTKKAGAPNVSYSFPHYFSFIPKVTPTVLHESLPPLLRVSVCTADLTLSLLCTGSSRFHLQEADSFLCFRDIIFIREKWSGTTDLQDTFSSIHDCNLIFRHQLFACFLVIQSKGLLITPRLRSVYRSMVSFPRSSLISFKVVFSFPPRNSVVSQLPRMVSALSLYIAFN